MTLYGREDQELNLLMEAPAPRLGRRRFLQAAGLLGAAGVAGYAGGMLAGRGQQPGRLQEAPPPDPRRGCPHEEIQLLVLPAVQRHRRVSFS